MWILICLYCHVSVTILAAVFVFVVCIEVVQYHMNAEFKTSTAEQQVLKDTNIYYQLYSELDIALNS